jgi:hypothetical protein
VGTEFGINAEPKGLALAGRGTRLKSAYDCSFDFGCVFAIASNPAEIVEGKVLNVNRRVCKTAHTISLYHAFQLILLIH